MKIWETFNIIPNNKKLYEIALTHKSYLNENKSVQESYERLEWMGDAVLQYYTTKYIFSKAKKLDEGQMTLIRKNAVETKTLSYFSKELGLNEFLLVGKSEDIVRTKLQADIFESFLGALFQDEQFDVIDIILKATVYKIIDSTISDSSQLKNSKTKFQENIKIENNQIIEYKIIKEDGPAHNINFTAQVLVDEIIMGEGVGKTKQLAEVAAAENALSKLIK